MFIGLIFLDSDKAWSSSPIASRVEYNGTPTNRSNTSTPTTISSGDSTLDDDKLMENNKDDTLKGKDNVGWVLKHYGLVITKRRVNMHDKWQKCINVF